MALEFTNNFNFAPYFIKKNNLKIGPERDSRAKFFARNPEIDVCNIMIDIH